jgi:hypothetical protein
LCKQKTPDTGSRRTAVVPLSHSVGRFISSISITGRNTMSHEFTEIGIPDHIQVDKEFQHLRIVRKWFGFKFVFLTLFVIVWDAFLINWYSNGFSSSFQDGFELMFVLFPLVHVAVGLGLTYYVLAGYLNKTFIDVDFTSLSIKHAPLPFWGNKTVSSKTIRQLYCKRDDFPNHRNSYRTFAIHAITSERRNIKLLSGLDTSEQALFIEQEIEKFLNIEDKPVKGEIR